MNRSAGRFGATAKNIPLAAIGAVSALVLVLVVGVVVHAPLSRVPENTLKFAVGLLLTSFGTFWAAEGAGANWPASDGAIIALLILYGAISFLFVQALDRRRTITLQAAA